MRTFSVKNFDRFQHYKDRSPPWIKLYNELLDDYEFGLLPDASKMHLVAIWLLASRSENKIPYDSEWVARRINANTTVDLDLLVRSGFLLLDQELHNMEQDASAVLAKCLTREREETEGERESSSAEKTRERKKVEYSAEFETKFWKPYPPSNSSKLEAWKQWQRMSPEDRNDACRAVEPYKLSMQGSEKFIVHACRFLSQRRFETVLANGTAVAASFQIADRRVDPRL